MTEHGSASRDRAIDILRGLAIFIMVGANMSALVWAEPHPFWFRLYGTFAAPFFVILSGIMVAYGKGRGKTFADMLMRGVLLVLVGVVVDVAVWQVRPFTTYDVLYLIGLGVPCTYLLLRLKPGIRWLVIGFFFALAPVLQRVCGYTEYPTEISLNGELAVTVANQTSILNHWLVDGWFPVFPWLGFSLLGGALGELRLGGKQGGGGRRILVPAAALLAVGTVAWLLYPGARYVREGYGELFYEPTPGFAMVACAVFLLVDRMVSASQNHPAYGVLMVLGECSLFMYVFHSALIKYVIGEKWEKQEAPTFFILYAATLAVMMLVGLLLRVVRRKWPRRPYLVRFILGG